MPNVWPAVGRGPWAVGRGPGCAVLDLERGGLERGGLERGGLDLGDQLRDDLDQLRDSQADCLLIDKQTTNKQGADLRGLDLDQLRGAAQLVEVEAGGRRRGPAGRVKYLYSFTSGACYSDT